MVRCARVVLMILCGLCVEIFSATIELSDDTAESYPKVIFQSEVAETPTELRLAQDDTLVVHGNALITGDLSVLGESEFLGLAPEELTDALSNMTEEVADLKKFTKYEEPISNELDFSAASSYDEVMQLLKPTIYYTFDEDDFSACLDSSGNEHHAEYTDSEHLAKSHFPNQFDPLVYDPHRPEGKCMKVHPQSNQATGVKRSPTGIELDSVFTTTLWFSMDALPGGYHSWILGYGGRDDCCCAGDQKFDHDSIQVFVNKDTLQLVVSFDNDWVWGDNAAVYSNDTIELGHVYFLTITWDKSADRRIRIYLDGVLNGVSEPWNKYVTPSAIYQSLDGDTGWTVMFRESGASCSPCPLCAGSRQLFGRIDNFAYWNDQAISEAAIAALYAHGRPPIVPPTDVWTEAIDYSALILALEPTLYYKMDPANTNFAYDESGNNNHGNWSFPEHLVSGSGLCSDGGYAMATQGATNQKTGIVRSPTGIEADSAITLVTHFYLTGFGTYDAWILMYGGRDDCCCTGDQPFDHDTVQIYVHNSLRQVIVRLESDWEWGDTAAVNSNTTIELGVLYHLVVTWDKNGDGRPRIYLNGVLDAVGEPWKKFIGPSAVTYETGGNTNFCIMHRDHGSGCNACPSCSGLRQFKGSLDNLAYWHNTAIPPEAVAKLYELGL